ncbi:MAG: hypothetical protein H6810_07115 [Phycisphaeraceae bacterium]|nr:MAG: hypothetical protein H6810_07115 [Phycisphaeraceae bacterium]
MGFGRYRRFLERRGAPLYEQNKMLSPATGVLIGLVALSTALFFFTLHKTQPVRRLSILISVPTAVWMLARSVRIERAMRTAATETEGCCCPRCLYDLRESPPDEACPECGEMTPRAELPRIWSKYTPKDGPGWRTARMLEQYEQADRPDTPPRDSGSPPDQ